MYVRGRDLLCERGASVLCNGRGGGRVMDIYDMDFDDLMDYIGDGDPAEIIG